MNLKISTVSKVLAPTAVDSVSPKKRFTSAILPVSLIVNKQKIIDIKVLTNIFTNKPMLTLNIDLI